LKPAGVHRLERAPMRAEHGAAWRWAFALRAGRAWVALRLALALALVCSAFAALPGHAQTADVAAAPSAYSAAYRDCMQRAGGVSADMHACISSESAAQNARLNALYGQLRGSLAAPRQAALQAAQRDWLRFRNSNCGYRKDPRDGSIATLAAGLCLLRMTTERADELQALQPPR
jgi:uncharacterized protein YecT (DUF1311 family)